MQPACVRRQREANVHGSAGRRQEIVFKVLGGGVRHVRPLAAVAHVGDVALLRGGDGGVDLCTPRHVGTHAEEVLQLGGRQSGVFVLRQRKLLGHKNNHWSSETGIDQQRARKQRKQQNSPHRTCQTAAAETGNRGS